MKRLAVLVSGNGTNMENLIQNAREGKLKAQVALVLSDNPNAYALKRAEKYNVECVVVDRKRFESKDLFETEILRYLNQKHIDFIVLAGFMRILSAGFVQAHKGRLVNIHPSLLPQFPGAQAIKDAWEAKAEVTGATVHFVDEDVDSGPVILQRKVKVEKGESLESLEQKIHAVEYQIYPEALNLILEGKVSL